MSAGRFWGGGPRGGFFLLGGGGGNTAAAGRWSVGVCERGAVVDLDPNGGVRTHQRAFVALDAEFGLPHGYLEGDVPFLPHGRAHRIRAVFRHRAHGERVSFACNDGAGKRADEFGRLRRHGGGRRHP